MKLFVPGRICLFGEHSDWAGGYRRINADIEKGHAVITGTNQGIYAEVNAHPSKLILRSILNDGSIKTCELPMEPSALLKAAEKGDFFSYAAGVAYQVTTHYRVRGLEINNYKTDIPVKKGLSSSAAICVLTARAFNRFYNLKLTTRGEMELAYNGETTTPSRCGRLDQGCAYGDKPILMTFDADRIDVSQLAIPNDMYFVIVDLNASKDTRKILSQLNKCFPFAESDIHRNAQHYLGAINAEIVSKAVVEINAGNAEALGKLMTEAQAQFDKHLQPACPSQLTAPVLHKVLNYAPIQQYVYGGKGVGSQGDGTAQFIAKNKECQKKVMEILQKDLGMTCLDLDLKAARRVRKAVIPAAGFGTRLFPATKAIKKELFPVIDSTGRAKPAILAIVEEAISAGIEEICILVQSEDKAIFEEIFCSPPPIKNFNKLSIENQKYCDYLLDIGHKITFLPQDVQDGFGHAVYCAREWVGEEPFLLLLGDHLYASDSDVSCARQLLDAYERVGQSVVGLKETPTDKVKHFGCVTGEWKEPKSLLSVTEFYEKPDAEYAVKHLHVSGMDSDKFLTVFGQYVLSPKIFNYLEENITHNIRERGEFQLTSCLEQLRQEDGFSGYVVQGRRFDIGNPEAYLQTLNSFGKNNNHA